MSKILTTRVDQETAERITQASKNSKVEKATFLRVLITKGLQDVEQEETLRQYQEGEVSLGKLTELLGGTIWDTLQLLQEKHIHMNYGDDQLREDIREFPR